MAYVKYLVGDIVQMKKPHPCGSHEWEITRLGADMGLRCTGCGHRVLLNREKFEKSVKKILTRGTPEQQIRPKDYFDN